MKKTIILPFGAFSARANLFLSPYFCVCLFLTLFICSCAPPKSDKSSKEPKTTEAISSDKITTFHSGALSLDAHSDAPKIIYVDAGHNLSAAPELAKSLNQALGQKFTLVDAPSKAGYILHVNILRSGDVSPESLKALVAAGYSKDAGFAGSGGQGMLVDAILAQRRVPSHKRPSRQKLKNISSRNVLDSCQMRIGAIAMTREAPSLGLTLALGDAIANDLAESLGEKH